MKRWMLSLCLITSILAADTIDDEEPTGVGRKKPGYATRDATVLSMMGWGIVIAVAIATFTGLVSNSTATTTPTNQ